MGLSRISLSVGAWHHWWNELNVCLFLPALIVDCDYNVCITAQTGASPRCALYKVHHSSGGLWN